MAREEGVIFFRSENDVGSFSQMFHVKSQAKANRFMLFESILELETKLEEAEAHRPCLDDVLQATWSEICSGGSHQRFFT